MHKSQSFCMQKYAWLHHTKTCIGRIIEHNTDFFHKEHIIESSVCEMSSSNWISIGDK